MCYRLIRYGQSLTPSSLAQNLNGFMLYAHDNRVGPYDFLKGHSLSLRKEANLVFFS